MYLSSKIKCLLLFVFLFISNAKGQSETIHFLQKQLQNHSQKDTVRVNLLNDLAWENRKIDQGKALKYALEAESISKEIDFFRGNAESKIRIGTIYTDQNKLIEAERIILEALAIEKQILHEYGIGRARNQLGRIYTLQNNSDKAISYYLKALDNFRTLELQPNIASTYNNIGVLYENEGNYIKAIEYYFETLKIRRELEDPESTVYILSNIGGLYINLGLYKSALKYLHESESILQNTDQVYELSNVYTNLGIAYFQKRDLSVAFDYNQKAINLNEKLNLKSKNIPLYNTLGSISYVNNNFEKALTYYLESLKLSDTYNQDYYNSETYYNIGNIKFEERKYEDAIKYYQKSLEVAKKSDNKNIQLEATKNLAASYTELKQHERAIKFNSKYIQLKDSMFFSEKSAIVKKASLEEEQMELNLLAKDKIITQQELDYSTVKNYALTIGLFLFILLLIAIVSRNAQKRKADSAIIEQQKIEKLIKNQEIKYMNAMIEGQENERQRIARDLHDRLGNILSMVKVHFKSVEENIEELKISNKKQYDKANQLLDDACDEVRKISHDMASGVLTKFGLIAALEDLKETLEETNRIEVDFISHGLNDRLDASIEIPIYRIIQELISNILRYAQAKSITIQLISNDNELRLSVEDDGVGFDINDDENWGIGLRNVASRVDALEGNLKIDSVINEGTNVFIDIPLKEVEL